MNLVPLLLVLATLAMATPRGLRGRAAGTRRSCVQGVRRQPEPDPLAGASSLDVFAVCLTAGMSVAEAAAVTAASSPPELARALRGAADLLALGADHRIAWSSPDPSPNVLIAAVLRLARRSGSSGSALAAGLAELADEHRRRATDAATAAAERASVLIAGPLAACFLPAFICLGVIPVVAGLAGGLLGPGPI